MKPSNRIISALLTFANGAINYILTTLFGLLFYVVIPCSVFLPIYALLHGHYAFAFITGTISLIAFLGARAISQKRRKKEQMEEAEQLEKRKEGQKLKKREQLEEIAVLMHELREDYALGKISDEEFDQRLDYINCLESEAGISMDESIEIDYESIYRAVQLKAQTQAEIGKFRA